MNRYQLQCTIKAYEVNVLRAYLVSENLDDILTFENIEKLRGRSKG